MLKKIISKTLLTVAVDKKARKKINDLGRHKQSLKIQIRPDNLEDSASLPSQSLDDYYRSDPSSEQRKRTSKPVEQIEEYNKLKREVATGVKIETKQQNIAMSQLTPVNPEREALIMEAMAIRRSKLHILNELDQEQLDKLTAMAIQALNIQIKN